MKKLFLFVALFAWIGFSASAQIKQPDPLDVPPQPATDMNMPQVQPTNQDSLKYDRMSEHWLYRDGKVIHMNQGVESPFEEQKEINGVWLRPNGDVVLKNNKTVRLKDNQYVDSKGEIRTMDNNQNQSNTGQNQSNTR